MSLSEKTGGMPTVDGWSGECNTLTIHQTPITRASRPPKRAPEPTVGRGNDDDGRGRQRRAVDGVRRVVELLQTRRQLAEGHAETDDEVVRCREQIRERMRELSIVLRECGQASPNRSNPHFAL